jgi:hypothetical protein
MKRLTDVAIVFLFVCDLSRCNFADLVGKFGFIFIARARQRARKRQAPVPFEYLVAALPFSGKPTRLADGLGQRSVLRENADSPRFHDTPHVPLMMEQWFPVLSAILNKAWRATSADKLSMPEYYAHAV